MQLIDGAQAIAGDLPRASVHDRRHPARGGRVPRHRRPSLQHTAPHPRTRRSGARPDHRAGHPDRRRLRRRGRARSDTRSRRHPDLAVVWLDAHPDLHTPESSTSGRLQRHGAARRSSARAQTGLVARLGRGARPAASSWPGPASTSPPRTTRSTDARPHHASAGDLRRRRRPRDGRRGHRSDGGVHPRRPRCARSCRDERGTPIRALRRRRSPISSPRSRACAPTCRWSARASRASRPPSPAAAVDDLGTILRIVGALA